MPCSFVCLIQSAMLARSLFHLSVPGASYRLFVLLNDQGHDVVCTFVLSFLSLQTMDFRLRTGVTNNFSVIIDYSGIFQ